MWNAIIGSLICPRPRLHFNLTRRLGMGYGAGDYQAFLASNCSLEEAKVAVRLVTAAGSMAPFVDRTARMRIEELERRVGRSAAAG